MPDEPNQLNRDLEVIGSDAPPSSSLEADTASKKEFKELFGDALRDEQQKHAFHVVFLWFIRTVAVCFILVFLVRIIHYVLPLQYCWLSETQLQGIDKSIFSGVLGALVARYSKQALRT